MIEKIKTFILGPICPSGLGHRVSGGTVFNINGKQFCWHTDCMKRNFIDCETHECNFNFTKVTTLIGPEYVLCRCGKSKIVQK